MFTKDEKKKNNNPNEQSNKSQFRRFLEEAIFFDNGFFAIGAAQSSAQENKRVHAEELPPASSVIKSI